MDLGIFQETKLTPGIYTRGSAGYSVIATDAPSRHRGGVALFYGSEPHFVVEAVEKFGPNVIGFQLVDLPPLANLSTRLQIRCSRDISVTSMTFGL